jgi:hypothetical protein
MVVCSREIGLTTGWKEEEFSLGVTVASTLVTTKMIRNTVPEPLHGQMDDATKESGTRANSTGRASTSKKARSDTVFGKWGKE